GRGREDVDAIAVVNARLEGIFDRVHRAGQDALERLGSGASEAEQETAYVAAAAQSAPRALDELAAFTKEYPRKAASAETQAQKMVLQLRAGQLDAAKATAQPLLTSAKESGKVELIDEIRHYWLAKNYNPERKHLDV